MLKYKEDNENIINREGIITLIAMDDTFTNKRTFLCLKGE